MNATKKRFLDLAQELSPHGHLLHVSQLLPRACKLWPERIALICNEEQISYQDLYDDIVSLAHKLKALGLQHKARVLIMYENSINFYKAYHAAWHAGAIVVPLNVYLHEKELEHIINDSKPHIIIASEPQKKKLENITFDATLLTEDFFIIREHTTQPLETPAYQQTDCAVILYTSGTTGLPKGVMVSSQGIITNCMQGIANFDITGNERIYAALPLFHSYMENAAVWSPLIVGATVIVVPSITRGALLKGLALRPTVVLGIPHLFGLFALMKTAPFPDVKLFVSGGDALHNKIRMGFELIYNRKITNGYGLTETGPFISVDIDDARRPAGCVGKGMEDVCVEIRDHDGTVLPACTPGTLWVKGNNCMLGYYNAPEATTKIMIDGWINTGDSAYVTTDGFIVLCGRERDIISHKGFKIYPPEIENILTGHPAVMMAAVVGVMRDGVESPVAFVASKMNPEELIPELKILCENNVARYKIPVQFYVKNELPMTATGKLDKKLLRKELEGKNTLQ